MRALRRSLVAALFIAPQLMLAFVAWRVAGKAVRRMESQLPAVLSTEATRLLKREVRIGTIRIASGSIVATDVSVGGRMGVGEGDLARAPRVEATLNTAVLTGRKPGDPPVLTRLKVYRPVGRITRDARGQWSIADLIHPRKPGQPSQAFGVIEVVDGRAHYSDEVLRGRSSASPGRFSATVEHVTGSLAMDPDGGLTWSCTADESAGRVRGLRVTGTYERETRTLGLAVGVERARPGALVAPWIPARYRLVEPTADGTVSIVWRFGKGGGATWDAAGDVAAPSVTVPQLAEPVRSVRGHVAWRRGRVDADLTGSAAGSPVRFAGALVRGDAWLIDGTLSGRGLRPDRVWRALRRGEVPPLLRRIDAAADGAMRLRGRLSAPYVQAAGRAELSAAPSEAGAPAGRAGVRYRVWGLWGNPSAALRAYAPTATLSGVEVRGLHGSADLADGLATVRLEGRAAGGAVTVEAQGRPFAPRRPYRAVARVRHLRLASAPWKRLGAPRADQADGSLDLDVSAWTDRGDRRPDARVALRLSEPRWGGRSADRVQIDAVLRGDALNLRRAELKSPAGAVRLWGSADLHDRSLNLSAEADGVSLPRLRDLIAETPAAPADAAPEDGLRGRLTVRDAQITGSVDDPRIVATVRGFGVGWGQQTGRLTASLSGGLDRIDIDGVATRQTAEAAVSGAILRPLSGEPLVKMIATVRDLELDDLMPAGSDSAEITGAADALLSLTGPLKRPTLTVEEATMERLAVGEVDLTQLRAGGIVCWTDHGPTLEVTDARAHLAGGLVAGDARLDADGNAAMRLSASDLSLASLGRSFEAMVALTGRGDVTVSGSARLADGRLQDLAGRADLGTRGLTVNGHVFGEASANLALQRGRIVAVPGADGSAPVQIGEPGREVALQSLIYDTAAGSLLAVGEARGLPAELLQGAALESPWVAERLGSSLEAISPGNARLEGGLSGSFSLSGALDGLSGQLTIASRDLRLNGKPIDLFETSAEWSAGRVALRKAGLEVGSMRFRATGAYAPGQRPTGEVSLRNLSAEMVQGYFPEMEGLKGLRGSVDSLLVTSRQTIPGAPARVSGAALLTGLGAQGSDAAIPRIEITGVELTQTKLNVGDVAIHLLEPKRGPMAAAPVVHATGGVAFRAQTPFIDETSLVRADVSLSEQSLETLQGLMPNAGLDMKGSIGGSLAFSGALGDLLDLPRAVRQGGAPDLTGSITLRAERLGAGLARTRLEDVAARIQLTGGSLWVAPADGKAVAANLVDAVRGRKEPLIVAGELPLSLGRKVRTPLRITSQRPSFVESPLPILKSGRAEGWLAGSDPNKPIASAPPGLDIVVSGSLFDPRVSGDIRLRRTAVRLPDALPEFRTDRPVPAINPIFDVRIHAEERVAVAASTLAASVRTAPSRPIRIGGDLGAPKVIGDLVVEGGSLTFPTARFALQPGGLVSMRYPNYTGTATGDGSFGLTVAATATSRITAVSVTGNTTRYTITVDARGSLFGDTPLTVGGADAAAGVDKGLRLTFRSEPADLALSQAGLQKRVLGLVGGQSALEGLFAGGGGVGRVLGRQFTDFVSSSVLPDLLERSGLMSALGFYDLSLDYGKTEALAVRVSRNLSGPYDLTYWQRLSDAAAESTAASGAWELKLSRRFGRDLRLSWTTNEQRTNEYLLEGVFRF
ncbi:MAG: translocation/assembly module TamB domain-containing protein [Armatimonadetes bacterium]|nr:translocation/assembly module TamB domain-containing protein [Armatimonadota bacterium]